MIKYPIPEAVLQQNIIALGKTGAGKSSALRVIVEAMLTDQFPLCILDPKGDWWGLRLSADGRKPGYPLVIFGGKHADVPIDERSGSAVAELFATGNRPCIIDLGGWMPGERTRFFIDFASTLFRKNVGRRWLLIDEVHNFAPKGKVLDPAAGKGLHWANRIASEGRGLGITLIGASQRPQKVHNDLLTSCETLIAMRVLHASDRGAYKDWIDGCGDPAKGKEMLANIANLKRGTGYVWSPEIEFGPELVKFPMFKTFDSFSPQTADHAVSSASWDTVDLEEVKTKLATVVKEAEDNDPKRLRGEIHKLHNEIVNLKAAGTGDKVDNDALEKAEERGYDRGRADALTGVVKVLKDTREHLTSALMNVDAVTHETGMAQLKAIPAYSTVTPRIEYKVAPAKRVPAISQNHEKSSVDFDLAPGERAILTACAQYVGGCDREQLSVLAGYKRSSRDTYIQRLKANGLLAIVDNRLAATEAGFAALGNFERLPTGIALQEYWFQRLPEGERKILQAVCGARDGNINREDLDALTGYKRSSRDTYLQRLRARQLVTTDGGMVRAAAILFD